MNSLHSEITIGSKIVEINNEDNGVFTITDIYVTNTGITRFHAIFDNRSIDAPADSFGVVS